MSDSVRPHRRHPTRPHCPWESLGKNTGVGCQFLLQCMKVKVKSLSRIRLLATPWTAADQAPPSIGFSRQEYWSGVPLPSPDTLLYLLQISFLYIISHLIFYVVFVIERLKQANRKTMVISSHLFFRGFVFLCFIFISNYIVSLVVPN